MQESQKFLSDSLLDAAKQWKEQATVSAVRLDTLDRAAAAADSAVREVRASAVSNAAAVPWKEAMSSVKTLERADGAAGGASVDSLNGKTVGLFFTASWCGPCRRFSPLLVNLYETVRSLRGGAAPSPSADFEVVLVSWDEMTAERQAYAQASKMGWLALPHAERALADELTLRYDVQFIPTLIVLEISPDGKEAKVVSRDGRDEVVRGAGSAEWLRRVTSTGGVGGDAMSGGSGAGGGGGFWSSWVSNGK